MLLRIWSSKSYEGIMLDSSLSWFPFGCQRYLQFHKHLFCHINWIYSVYAALVIITQCCSADTDSLQNSFVIYKCEYLTLQMEGHVEIMNRFNVAAKSFLFICIRQSINFVTTHLFLPTIMDLLIERYKLLKSPCQETFILAHIQVHLTDGVNHSQREGNFWI